MAEADDDLWTVVYEGLAVAVVRAASGNGALAVGLPFVWIALASRDGVELSAEAAMAARLPNEELARVAVRRPTRGELGRFRAVGTLDGDVPLTALPLIGDDDDGEPMSR